MEAMKEMQDKAFELAIVDPPYGDGGGGQWDGKPRSRFGGRFAKYSIGESIMRSEGGSQSDKNGRHLGNKIPDQRRLL